MAEHPELVTAYYLCHGHWTVVPHQLEENFEDMAACGFNAVAMSFSESEMAYARRAFEIQITLAKKHGLKCLVIPSRLGGRFAGAPLMPSMWLATHPEARVPDRPGWPVACLESEAYRDWMRTFMGVLMTDYDLDGIIWDEPKAVGDISRHPDTLARYGPEPTGEQMQDAFVEFLDMLTRHCRGLRRELAVTLFAQKTDPACFTGKAAQLDCLDYFGYDGNLARQSRFHEEPAWAKYRIESAWERTVEECRAAGRKSFSLVENMLMPACAIPEYEENFDRYLQGPLPDHLSIYYYAHNNEDPEKVHKVTRRLMQQHLG